ncbi:MAG: glycosyltransferase [Pseudomonadota bacterium]
MIDPRDPDSGNPPVSPQRPRYPYAPETLDAVPVVSVVTTMGGTAAQLTQTAASVFGQSLQAFEWIVVGDDATARERLFAEQGRDPRLRVVERGPLLGAGRALDEGIHAAHAPFVVPLDCGDQLEPTALEKWSWHLASFPEHAWVSSFSVVPGNTGECRTQPLDSGTQASRRLAPPPAVVMLRRELVEKLGGFGDSLCATQVTSDFWRRCTDLGLRGETLPEFLHWHLCEHETTHRRASLRSLALATPMLRQEPFARLPEELPFANRLRTQRRRLLMVVPWLTLGGADRFNLDLVRWLDAHDVEVSLCGTKPGPSSWLPQFARTTPDIFLLPSFLRLPDYPRFLCYLIESRAIDVVLLSHSELGYRLLPYLRSRCPQVTYLDYNHVVERGWQGGGHPRSGVGYQDLLDLSVVSSEDLRQWMVQQGADQRRVAVCYTGVDPELWDPRTQDPLETRRELGIDPETPLLLFAGRLCTQKQPHLLAEVLRALKQRREKFCCVIAGDGDLRMFLTAYLRLHRLRDHVRMLGDVTSQDMRALMAAADILFLPSAWEGIAVSVYEAMASETVPVTADVGGQRELVTPECGVLVSPHADQLSSYVQALTDLMRSPEKRRAMASAGRRRICDQFPLTRSMDRMLELLDTAQREARLSPRPAISARLGSETAVQAIELARVEQELGPLFTFWGAVRWPRTLLGGLAAPMRPVRSMYWAASSLLRSTPLRDLAERLLGSGHI